MRECDVVIASPVVVRTFGDNSVANSSRQVVCKAWPLTQLPLDGWYHFHRLSRDLTILCGSWGGGGGGVIIAHGFMCSGKVCGNFMQNGLGMKVWE